MSNEQVQQVTAAQIAERLRKDGGLVLVGEYRGSTVAGVEYLDKATGQKAKYVKVVHAIETGSADGGLTVIHMQERVAKDLQDPKQYQTWMKKGQRIAVRPKGVENDKGIFKVSCDTADICLVVDGPPSTAPGK